MEEFITRVKEALEEHYGSDREVTVSEFRKNNGICLHGISIRKKGYNVAPVLYVEHSYSKYKDGVAFEKIISELIKAFDDEKDTAFDADVVTDFEKVKDSITYRVINKEKNVNLLTDVVSIGVLDLAIVFDINVRVSNANGKITVTKRIAEYWGISELELLDIAEKNTRKQKGVEIVPMHTMLEELAVDNSWYQEILSDENSEIIPLFILTNKDRLQGACCMLYLDVLKAFADMLKSDLFVIPSSVHECLLLPASKDSDVKELKDMIKSVNDSVVEADEILSDNCYFYDRTKNTLNLAV